MKTRSTLSLLAMCLSCCAASCSNAIAAPPAPEASASDSILLTIFLRHDESKTLAEIQQLQEEQGFYKSFPPAGTSVVSWNVLMGIGQVVTLRVPASKLRDVNVALEKTAWKAFHTEFYATYDLWPVIKDKLPSTQKEVCGK